MSESMGISDGWQPPVAIREKLVSARLPGRKCSHPMTEQESLDAAIHEHIELVAYDV